MIHFHDWQIAAVKWSMAVGSVPLEAATPELCAGMLEAAKDGIGIYTTRILYHCSKCAKLKVKAIPGVWTLEQVKGQA